ncbi:MBL fold metallo-hydrolase [Blochmannia endosymbiont of Camponotus (Colobopsis) obliquus]|uniref:MBL fold metallo-hydrolase n=1 Tax=Blochmannia endosymbiont of Camponotus (Colobopsis) obliquus TaxID=1505597 RepID=UPI00061A7403|nr:MBL fold metallo-hydrolase [Blochmannia endosymbiont of Camponotus (Colobopsis) obliquus]AKC60575.1 Uncharacterized protein YcbL [Blochmannia endosymbiont of Camponotus (Colobopsis) obliquus]
MKYQTITTTNFQQNCSLVWCKITKHAVLIDPGGEAIKLRRMIQDLKLIIKKILLTHGHLDHVGAAVELSKFYKIQIIGPHYNDKILLDNLPAQCQIFNVECIPSFSPHYWLKENNLINVGEITFNILHCPGHSPGHIVYWSKKHNLIFVGDVLFKEKIGRTDLPGGNIKQLLNSIQKKILTLQDVTVLIPGHGPLSTIGHERHNNPFLIKNL